MTPAPLTGISWLDVLLAALAAWGYVAVFAGGALENLFLVGGFVPGETIVAAVAFLASRSGGPNIYLVWLLSVLGTVAGSNVSYAIGRKGGRPLLERSLRRFKRMDRTLDRAAEYFELHGAKTVLIARFTAGFKNFVPALAGVARMRLRVFEAYTVLGAVLYSTLLCFLGYKFGENLDTIVTWFKRAGIIAAVVAVALVAAYVAFRAWRSRDIRRQVDDHLAETTADDLEGGSTTEPPGLDAGDEA